MTVWIGTSWKMNKTLAEGLAFAEAMAGFAAILDDRIQPFVVPPFTATREVKRALADTRVKVGAQNMHWDDAGPWTGEVSPLMLKDCGVDLVELGHSERRRHFGETDETVGLKTAAAVRHGIIPLVCVGETGEERDAGRADEVLEAQVDGSLDHLDDDRVDVPILFAYEPVWAIGEAGTPASPDYANRAQSLIKRVAAARLGTEPPVLYGGSVNPDNAAELLGQPSIDGLFVGRAAWAPEGYRRILDEACAAI